jgi:Flp pilus assembly pilin Flp
MIIDMIKNTVARFRKDEDGIALTEYLVLLGLLVAGVIGAVIAVRHPTLLSRGTSGATGSGRRPRG